MHYKTKNNILKIFFSLFIIVTVSIGYIMINNNAQQSVSSVENKDHLNEEFALILKDSIFEGVGKHLNQYIIKAEESIQDSDNKYRLNKINVVYKLEQDQPLIINAKYGLLNEELKILSLTNNVEFYLDDMLFNSSKAKIDLANKDITSDAPVTLFQKDSSISADNFNTKNDNNLIIFKGNVSTTINLSNY